MYTQLKLQSYCPLKNIIFLKKEDYMKENVKGFLFRIVIS